MNAVRTAVHCGTSVSEVGLQPFLLQSPLTAPQLLRLSWSDMSPAGGLATARAATMAMMAREEKVFIFVCFGTEVRGI